MTTDRAREILGDAGRRLSDQEIAEAMEQAERVARLIVDLARRERRQAREQAAA